MRWLLSIVLLALVSCTTTANVECATGRVCPSGLVCSKTGDACGSAAQAEACLTVDDGFECSSADAPVGVCRLGICEAIECGNGFPEPGEQCDDGNQDDEFDLCRNDCTAILGTCGNGIIDGEDEECDCGDGTGDLPPPCRQANAVDSGLCSTSCRLHCGDGVQSPHEACEPGLRADTDCLGLGAEVGLLECTSQCSYDAGQCALFGWIGVGPSDGGPQLTALWRSPRDRSAYSSPRVPELYATTRENGQLRWVVAGGQALLFDAGQAMHDVWGYLPSDGASEVLYAVGDAGTLLRNGAPDQMQWAAENSGTTETLHGIWGIDQVPLFAVGGNGVAQRFTQGTWQSTSTGISDTLFAIDGLSTTNVLAVGDGGVAIHWNGSAWAIEDTGTTETLRALWMDSSGIAYAVGDRGTVLLRSLEATWNPVDVGTVVDLYSVWGRSVQDVFVGGDLGTIVHHGIDGLWRPQITDHIERVTDLDGSPTGRNLSVGTQVQQGYGYDDGAPLLNTGVPMNDIEAAPTGEMFAVGDQGTIYHFDRVRWTPMDSNSLVDLQGVWVVSATEAYAAGADGTVLSLANGVWTDLLQPEPVSLNGIWAQSNYVVVVGDSGFASEFVDGAWKRITGLGTENLNAVWGTVPSTIEIVGVNSRRVRNGGSFTLTQPFEAGVGSAHDVKGPLEESASSSWWVGEADFFPGTFGTSNSAVGLLPVSVTAFLMLQQPLRAVAAVADNHAFLAGEQGLLIQVTATRFGRIETRTAATIRGLAYALGVLAYVAEDGTIDTMVLPPAALAEQ